MLGQRKWDRDGFSKRQPYLNRRMEYPAHKSYWDRATAGFPHRSVASMRLARIFRG